MQLNLEDTPGLAGAFCPSCETPCLFTIPDDAMASGVTTVAITCHNCGHGFETSIHGALGLPEAAPEPADLAPARVLETGGEVMIDHRIKPRASHKGLILGVLIALLMVGVVTAGVIHRAVLVELAGGLVASVSERMAAISAPPGEARFEIRDKGMKLNTIDGGTVLDIAVVVRNTGTAAGQPDGVVVSLVASDGAKLMTWPIDAPDKDAAPGDDLVFTSQLVEPPEEAVAIEALVY